MNKKVLIKGAGEHASGTAHRLFRCGFQVVMTELEQPAAPRRTVSFCSAIFDGEIVVEGVKGVRYTLDQGDSLSTFDWNHVPVFIDPQFRTKDIWKPDVIIDGRIMKKNVDVHIDDAPLVIGYGPGFNAGEDVDFVVETSRGHNLGRIISKGYSTPDTGVPGPIAGHSADRVFRSPAGGTLKTERQIGDLLEEGDPIGSVAGQPINAAISGVLHGLVFPGSQVVVNQKLGDIDPRSDRSVCYTLTDKTRSISGAALEIILSFFGSA